MKKNGTISLKTILIVPFIALIVIITGIIGYLSFLNGQKAVNNVAGQFQNEISKRIEDHLSAFLSLPQQINHINAISIQKNELDAENITSLEHHFWNQVKVFKSVSSIYFGNNQGGLVNSGRDKNSDSQYIIVTDHFKSGPFKKFNTDSLGKRTDLLLTVPNFDARKRQWYKGAIESGNQFWSPVYILFTGQDLAIAASRPVYDDNGRLLGVVSIDLFLSHINSFLESLSIGKTGHAFIMEDSGLLIASSTGTKLFTESKEDKTRKRLKSIESESPLIRHASASLKSKFKDFNSITTEQQIIFTLDHQRYFLQVTPIERNGLKWLISVIIPENDFMGKIKAGNRLTATFILVALIVVLFACILLAKKIASPIFSLINDAQRLAKGKWKSKITKNSRIFEINILTHSFNQMADQLQKGLNDLHIEINERKQTEEKLKKREAYLRTVIETIPDLVWLKDPDGVYLSCNKRFERFFGAKEEEIVGKTDYDFVEKKLADFFREKDKIAMEAGKPSVNEEDIVYADDGHRELLETIKTPMYDPKENIVGILGIARDITQRKKAEETIRLSEERLNSILQTNPNPVVVYDTKGFPLFINPSFTEVFGWTLSEIKGRNIPFVPDDEKNITLSKIKEIYNTGKPVQFFTKRLTKSNEVLDININAAIYKDIQGEKTGLVVNLTDITEQIKIQEQLRHAQKMESVGRLAGGVAHDFNNMLSVILGNAEILAEDLKLSETSILNLQEIQKAAERSTNLTRQLLAFARKQTISPEIVDLNDIIHGVLKMLERLIGEDIELLWQPKIGLWPVKVDPSQIDQILANLCVNARDSIEGIGKIVIETDNVQFNDAYCRNHPGFIPGDYAQILVSDTGHGMEKDVLDNLFEPFFTTKGIGEGTGLGLATVYGIVKQNNGFINVDSELNLGTTFKIYLPRFAEKEEIGVQEIVQAKPQKGNETILLVEDEEAILKMTQMMLERLGYTVLATNNPDEAIRLSHAAKTEIHILITDVVMPFMNGRELAEKILKTFPKMKCLYMSGYTANIIADNGILDEGLNFINKPFSKLELSAKLRELLNEFRP
ncbi:PAS domain S-box protein [Desulfobacter latus]|uniref:histidine kinase n=1 Tax=Desulfobacter latus TaxID=2292 RepID=A0A850T6A4_9BACT|nr:PAS domain S-box protein [Desulfobacter latus]NWH03767.1 PAS domain S-box protein [Desulfobacter latus]